VHERHKRQTDTTDGRAIAYSEREREFTFAKKLKQTQQSKHASITKCTTTENELPEKLKPGLVASYDLWPRNGEGLFWFQRFINLSLTYLDTDPLTVPALTRGDEGLDAIE